MINKLLLCRTKTTRSSLAAEAGVSAFIKGDPLKISPIAWKDEDGLSHWGFVLEGMKLDDLKALETWAATKEGVTILEHKGNVDETLQGVGLRINQAA